MGPCPEIIRNAPRGSRARKSMVLMAREEDVAPAAVGSFPLDPNCRCVFSQGPSPAFCYVGLTQHVELFGANEERNGKIGPDKGLTMLCQLFDML